jgi:DNA-binding NtrC family response regulator
MKSRPRPMRVLFADDETSLQELMKIELPRLGHEATVCPDGRAALEALERSAFDCVIVDLDMPGAGGLEVIARVREMAADTEAVILTGKSSVESAVTAVRQGVFDYLTKPCKLAEIEAVLERVRQKRELMHRLRALERRVRRAEGATRLVGDSPALARVSRLIDRVAASDATVLIRGETGTGKELVARAIHERSGRAAAPLVAVNCGALPEHLVESELFGHRKGAFTGAEEHRAGLFEVAHGGTLFLDEIGELPKPLQSRLLRVLESGEIRRVGDNHSLTVDVRVVCATHRSLEEMVASGEFREDLLFRINTFEVFVPPLRERREDIPALVEHFVRKVRPHVPAATAVIDEDALEVLAAHHWPGNVRELANAIEHALVLSDELPLKLADLPARLLAAHPERSAATPGRLPAAAGAAGASPGERPLSLREMEAQAILEALDRHQGNKPRTAEELGISLKTLYNKLHQMQDGEAVRTA